MTDFMRFAVGGESNEHAPHAIFCDAHVRAIVRSTVVLSRLVVNLSGHGAVFFDE